MSANTKCSILQGKKSAEEAESDITVINDSSCYWKVYTRRVAISRKGACATLSQNEHVFPQRTLCHANQLLTVERVDSTEEDSRDPYVHDNPLFPFKHVIISFRGMFELS